LNEEISKTIYTDRSRALRYQQCPRSRWWEYEYGGRGLRRARLNIPLTVGTWVHEGVGRLLNDARRGEAGNVQAAISQALDGYTGQVSSRGFDLEANEDVAFVVSEQAALIEALIRLWHLRSTTLQQFTVLEVEREDQLPLATRTFGKELVWQARADALLREKDGEDLYVFSLKTAARWDDRQQSSNEHDMQGLSEAAAIEARLGRKIFGVRMEYLLKGERRKDDVTGAYRQSNPLIRGYRRPAGAGVTEDSWEYAHSWYYNCSEPHQVRKSKWCPTGECPGGRRHSLGGNWESFNVWDEMGIADWIEMLNAGIIQPIAGDVLDRQLVSPLPYFRDQIQMDDWREQVRAQEERVSMAAKLCREELDDPRGSLNIYFPQHSRSCDYPVKCDYQELCFGADHIRRNPLMSGYDWREPHHAPELEQIREAA
jgi:hypothetical protein